MDTGQNRCDRKGVGHFKHKFQGERGTVLRLLSSENLESLSYHVALFMFSRFEQYRHMTDTQRD